MSARTRARKNAGAQHSDETNSNSEVEVDNVREAMGGLTGEGGTLPPISPGESRIVKVATATFRQIRQPISWSEVQRWETPRGQQGVQHHQMG